MVSDWETTHVYATSRRACGNSSRTADFSG
jgi:hypothetical protein